MDHSHFIARRILLDKDRAVRFSKPIVAIAVLGIVIGMAVMIITVGITKGFQQEVRAKVTGAGGALQIVSIDQSDPKETPRIPIEQPFYPWLDTVPGIRHIQVYATRPGIIETGEEIEGIVLKGIGADHDPTFLNKHLVSGTLPAIGDPDRPIDLLLSRYHAARLGAALDDSVTVYLAKGPEDIRPRRFRICGLYETGLEQLDHQLAFVDIDHLQRFAQWGLKAEIRVENDKEGITTVEGLAFGGDRIYTFEWPGTNLKGPGPHNIGTADVSTDTTLTLVVHDADETIPDTAWVHIGHDGMEMSVLRGGSGGSHKRYCGGFEVDVDDLGDLMEMDDLVYRDHLDVGLRSLSVKDRFPEIFAWLELLDTNVIVIILLMIIVAIINMTSALLIIILERTPMIGVLKALGTTNGSIRKIFLIDAAYILGFGVFFGDLLGIALCMLQQRFGIVRLPVESYYVDAVPIILDPLPILLLNAGTMVICVLALVLPSLLVTTIPPARAIRFN